MVVNGFGRAMIELVGRWSRIFFVGFAFVVFGVGGC